MIRLVFVSTFAYNYFFPGKVNQAGGQTRIYNLARRFAQQEEYRVFCLVGDFGQPERVVRENVTLVKSSIDHPLGVFRVMNSIRSLRPDILVDFCASPRLAIYALLKKMIGIKYIFFTGSDNDVNGKYKEVENRIYDFFYRVGLRQADSIVAQVPLHTDLLRDAWGLKSHLVLSPYLDIRTPESVEKDIVLWVGRSAYYKRPELFVRLAEEHPGQKFVMICNTSPYDKGFMVSIAKLLKRFSNLEFHEYVPYPEMKSFYSRAKLLVNTSDFEGFPNTFLEAAVQKTPVLSLNSDPNGMLSHYGGGIYCQGNFACMKLTLAEMLATPGLLTKQGLCGFEYASRFHRIDRAVKKMDTIFKGIAWKE